MFTQYQLKNKLKVLLVPSHKAPVVAVQMWVKTGSADEKKGEEGISHFIEHLVFKGTRNYGVGEIAKAVEGSGGELNAYTTFDHTVFHVTMSKTELDVGLDCISEMMGFPRFDPDEIDKEREVVIEEIKRSFDNPGSVASQQLFSTLFKKHPYGIPVIGYDKNIRKVSTKVLTGYYQRRYVPSNMTLVIAGDFDQKEIKKQVALHYDEFRPFALKKVKRVPEPKQTKPRTNYLATSFQESSINISFRAPPAKHADVPALDILGFILGQGDSSRLVRRLRLESSLVTGISAGSYNPLDSGLFAFSASFKPENLAAIMPILLEEIKTVLTRPLDLVELNRARLNLEADEIFSLETVDGLARKVGIFQTLLNDPNYIQTYLRKVQSLTPLDILKVARKYLTPENLNVTLMIHAKDKKVISEKAFGDITKHIAKTLKEALNTKVKSIVQKGAKPKTLKAALKSASTESKIVKHRLSNGALVILKRNPEIPVFDVKVGFPGGLRLERPADLGVTTLLSNTWTAGSVNFTEQEIASRIEGCAGSLSAFGGRNSIGMTLETLSINEKEAWEVFADVLQSPLFPQDAISREVTLQLEGLRTRGDHPSSVAVQAFMENIFRGHPYALDMMGTETSLASMTSQKVSDHWRRMVSPQNSIFVAVGDFDENKLLKSIEKVSSALKPGTKIAETFPVPALQAKRIFQKSEKEQSHIIVGYRGMSFKDPDRYIIELLQAILAGQGGRLFIELRDKASLAYTVSPVNMKGIETGYFGVYIGCSPEKGKIAIDMIHQELDKIVNVVPDSEEVERAKRYLIGRNHIDLQRNGAQASSILFDELYGIACEETFKYADYLKNLTPADVQRVAERLFTSEEIIVAVGPIQPW